MTKIKAMTEAEWLSGTKCDRMVQHLQQHVRISRTPGGARRLRLLAVAACRQVWPLLTDPHSRAAVEVAERYADGKASKKELRQAAADAEIVEHEFQTQWAKEARSHRQQEQERAAYQAWVPARMSKHATATRCLILSVRSVLSSIGSLHAASFADDPKAIAAAQQRGNTTACELLRDIVGNPFRATPAINDSWLIWQGGIIPRMARAIYEERAFERMPILADALQEAGSTDGTILGHCREGVHVRGCWLLDALRA